MENDSRNLSVLATTSLAVKHLVTGQKVKTIVLAVSLVIQAASLYGSNLIIGYVVDIATELVRANEETEEASVRRTFQNQLALLTAVVIVNISTYYLNAGLVASLMSCARAR